MNLKGAFLYRRPAVLRDPAGVVDGSYDSSRARAKFNERFGELDVRDELVSLSDKEGRSTLLLRGEMSIRSGGAHFTGRGAVDELHRQICLTGEIPLPLVEGAFTVVLLEHVTGRIVAFRNLVGCGNTFYSYVRGELIIAANLADLLAARSEKPTLNRQILPSYFLFRRVIGHSTLVQGVRRLLPGEMLEVKNGRLRVLQIQTLESFSDERGAISSRGEAVQQLEQTMEAICVDYLSARPKSGVLLSGGVDSSYLQAIWTDVGAAKDRGVEAYVATLAHERTAKDLEYARSAARQLRVSLHEFQINRPFSEYLVAAIAETGETPDHVQATYMLPLAAEMHRGGLDTAVCGEAADGLLGSDLSRNLHNAIAFRWLLPSCALRSAVRRIAGRLMQGRIAYYCQLATRLVDYDDIDHPVNQQSVFTDWRALLECFEERLVAAALRDRRDLAASFKPKADPFNLLQAAGFFGESIDTASYWATLFESQGVRLQCPFLDSRMLNYASNLVNPVKFAFRQPKRLLKDALARRISRHLAYRPKRGFGQPIFEWMQPGNVLDELVCRVRTFGVVSKSTLATMRGKPNWFLYSLLCLDVWYSLFIDREDVLGLCVIR